MALNSETYSEESSPPADRRGRFLERFDLAKTPTAPGCYLMRDAHHRVIYVGKAKNLRARLRAYLNENDSRYSVQFFMQRVTGVEFLVTTNEKEALLLENSLIKQYKPRYNVRLKDDKTYVSLRFNVQDDFPRLTVVRRCKRDGARYFGPYSSARSVRETLRGLQRMFPLRTCADSVLRNRSRPCLYYQMKQCCAPCVGYVDRDTYHDLARQVVMVLEGRSGELEKLLVQRIKDHADRLEFEKAAEVRDRLFALRRTLERQRTVAEEDLEDRDVFGVYAEGRFSEIQVLFFRGGKMLGGRSFSFNQREMPVEEVVSSFVLQYYAEAPSLPSEVLVPMNLEEADVLADILSEHRGQKVRVHWPQRGNKAALVDLANRNAKTNFEEKRLSEQAHRDLLEQVRDALKLSKVPQRIECFDISTTQGANPVGSMVVFEGGTPDKSRYRRYAIRRIQGQDDFAMLREVLMRRYERAVKENDLPELVLIDGGKGQLNVAMTVLKDLGIEDLDAASIVKERSLGEGAHSPERFFRPGRLNPIILPQSSPVVLFLARVRDEAHRFAVTYHRKRRADEVSRTPLLEIPGIGAKRAKFLLTAFGSLATIQTASVDQIASVPGFNKQLATVVVERLKSRSGSSSENEP